MSSGSRRVLTSFPDYENLFGASGSPERRSPSPPRTLKPLDSSVTSRPDLSWDFLASKLREAKNESGRDVRSPMTPDDRSRDSGRDSDRSQDVMETSNVQGEGGRRGTRSECSELPDYSGLFSDTRPQKRKRIVNPGDRYTVRNGQNILEKDKLLLDLVFNGKSDLASQLKMQKIAIVGLDHIVEFVDPEGAPRVYNCTLCKTFRSGQTIMDHLTSFNHRVRYIKTKFPNEAKTYMLPDGKTINWNKGLYYMSMKRCSDLELVYGRGDVVVKNERASIPEEEVDAPEDNLMVVDGGPNEWLKKVLKGMEKLQLEHPEDVRISKQIINVLTDAIFEHKIKTNNSQE